MGERLHDVRLLNVESTTRCNFTCGFCQGRLLPQADLDPATLELALETFPRAELLDVTGEGEPLLHPGLFELLAGVHRRGLRTSFHTNGSLLTDEVVQRILEARVETIFISIESPDPVVFRRLRGGSLEAVRAGIARLLRARAERRADQPSIGFAVTVLRSTRRHLGQIAALHRELGLDGGISIQVLNGMPGYARRYDDALAGEVLTEEEARALQREAGADPDLGPLLVPRAGGRGFDDELFGGHELSRGCPWLARAAFVSQAGRVMPCCTVKDPRHALGVLGRDGAATIADARDALRREISEGSIPTGCAGCSIAEAVAGACRRARLTGLEQELTSLEQTTAHLQQRLARTRRTLEELRGSRSWRVAAPLRRAYALLRGRTYR